MRTYLLLVGLMVVACDKNSDDGGGEGDATPETEAPEVWIEAGEGLPAGESSANSLEVTVTGNDTATEYQYALFSDESVTCATAKYGKFQKIDTKLVAIDLGSDGKKIICLRGKDKDDNEQANPKRYSWTKVSSTSEGELMPHAELEVPPSASDQKIDSKVKDTNDITVKYEYVLISLELEDTEYYDCADVESDPTHSYSPPKKIAEQLILDLGDDDRRKTLCLRGLDKDGRVQNNATVYNWVKLPPKMHEDSEIPAAGQPAIGLIEKPIAFVSGEGDAHSFTVKNIGTGILKWHAKTASAVDWLLVNDGNDEYVEIKAGEIAGGEIDADVNAHALVGFKLAKGKGTDYGEPYKREHEIIFVNEESKHEIKVKITLTIPKLDIQRVELSLTRNSEPTKVYVENLGEEGMDIRVVGGFPNNESVTRNDKLAMIDKFRRLVQYKTRLAHTGANKGKRYVELTITDAGKESCEAIEQTLIVYSNGDSKGIANCTVDATKSYLGGSVVWGGNENSGAFGHAEWTTGNCKRIAVSFNGWKRLDLNDDGKINIQDLVIAANEVGEPPNPMTDAYQHADVDGNGKVEKADLAAISACFGNKP